MKDFLVKIWLTNNAEIIMRIACPRDQILEVLRNYLSEFMNMSLFGSVLDSLSIEEVI